MTDIVQQLETYRASLRQESLDHEGPLAVMLGEAIAEIKHLRLVAGKVSRGFTFADVKAQAKNHEKTLTEDNPA
jgi:hypothetical protein